jgi:hypothetical protein
VDLVNGAFAYVPDTQTMTVSILEAASDITCQRTPASIAQARRGQLQAGDIEEAHRNPAALSTCTSSTAPEPGLLPAAWCKTTRSRAADRT